ncbi:hypothetical protein [Methanothrix sp.]|uniref:hypothetical protein n=1 Tax=Methanothrix sp. TaxID=90426 RepID=UPI003C769DFF
MILMIGSVESKTAPEGANHDEISPAMGLTGRENETEMDFPLATIIRSNRPGQSHPEGCGLLMELRVAVMNRGSIPRPEA